MSLQQVLSAEQMRAAEQRLFDAGMSVGELMEVAAEGAAQWVRRLAGGRRVTVLCGPGNNGGDGYVIARRLEEWGLRVQVVAPLTPKTQAAARARDAWGGTALTSGRDAQGEVFVDCLFGSGLARPLSAEHALLLRDLATRHSLRIAIDLPSGVASDTGAPLNEKLPHFDVTLALGAWKFAHCLALGRSYLGTQRLVPIGIGSVAGAAQRIGRPPLSAPHEKAHKYSRGQCAVVGGAMPGAALLSAQAAMRAGAGYVKLLGQACGGPAGLVQDPGPIEAALADARLRAVLVGPGLGRTDTARATLLAALTSSKALVIDADALHLLRPENAPEALRAVLTPHDGELDVLCRHFAVVAEGRMDRARALAAATGLVVLAKGPDSFVAAPDGALAIGPAASRWLSVAGSGDALAGIIVSRLATGSAPFSAACEALWLHAEAARICGPAFTADDLAASVSQALARSL